MESTRFQYLDGLRGVACMMVVAYHYSLCFQPHQPISLFLDGELAVSIFFLISGFILTNSFMRSSASIGGLVAGRLVRLLLPVAVAACAASILYTSCYPLPHDAALASQSPLLMVATDPPTLLDIPGSLLAALLGFAGRAQFPISSFIAPTQSSNAVIWTISYEIYGSILVLLLTRLHALRRSWWIIGLVASAGLFGFKELGLFVLGHCLRIGWRQYQDEQWNWAALISGLCAVLLFLQVDLFQWDRPLDFGGMFQHSSGLYGGHALIAAALFVPILYSRSIQRAFSFGPLLLLGRLSFSIYLIHAPIMMTFGSWLYLLTASHAAWTAWAISVSGAILTIAGAALFERTVDLPAITLGRKIRKLAIYRQGGAAFNGGSKNAAGSANLPETEVQLP